MDLIAVVHGPPRGFVFRLAAEEERGSRRESTSAAWAAVSPRPRAEGPFRPNYRPRERECSAVIILALLPYDRERAQSVYADGISAFDGGAGRVDLAVAPVKPNVVPSKMSVTVHADTSPYLRYPHRLADVLAAIQVMGAYTWASRKDSSWSKKLGNPASVAKWSTVFQEHPEFFRVSDDGWVSLRWRHGYDRKFEPERGHELSHKDFKSLTPDQKKTSRGDR